MNYDKDTAKACKCEIEEVVTREDAKSAFYELRRQAERVQEMSLDEINAEIAAVRKKIMVLIET